MSWGGNECIVAAANVIDAIIAIIHIPEDLKICTYCMVPEDGAKVKNFMILMHYHDHFFNLNT